MHAIDQKIFLFLALLLPTQLARHFWPTWSYILGRRVDYLSPALYFTDLILIILVISVAITRLQRFDVKTYKVVKHAWFALPLIILNILGAVSWELASWKWLKLAALAFLVWYIVKFRPNERKLRHTLLAGMFITISLAGLQFFLQHSVGSLYWWLGERTFSVDTPGIARTTLGVLMGNELVNGAIFLRPYGTLPHPNVLGGISTIVLPLFLFPEKTVSARIRILGIITLLTGVVLSLSRSAWIISTALILLYLFRNFLTQIKHHQKPMIPTITLTICIAVLSLVPLCTEFGESMAERKQLLVAAGGIVRDNPIFGVGLGNTLRVLPEYSSIRNVYFLQPVHNIYLLLLAEIGILAWIGIILMLRLIYKIFKQQTISAWHISLFTLLILGSLDHYPVTIQQGLVLSGIILGQVLRKQSPLASEAR